MKGIVFTVRHRHHFPRFTRHSRDIKAFLSKNILKILLFFIIFIGVFIGAFSSKSIETDTKSIYDFLFITNLSARKDMSAFSVFCSCFTADFVFLLAVFLFGFSAFGVAFVPLSLAFKGFSVGLCASYIIGRYALSGIGFFIMCVLPGVVLFLITLVFLSDESVNLSLRYLRLSFLSPEREPHLNIYIKDYLIKSLVAFVFTVASSLLDMTLWMLISGSFTFE